MARKKRRGGAITGRPAPGSKQQRPGSIPFQAELALAFQRMQAGHGVEAESIYRQIVARHKTHPQANFALAMLMNARGLAGAAIEHLQVVIQTQPDNLDAQTRLAASLRKLRRDEEALRHFKIAARLNSGDYALYNNMGNTCRDLRRVEDAEHYLLKAIELQPDAPEAHNNLGALFSEQGRTNEAIEQFRRAIVCKPDYAKAHRNLATTRKHEKYDDEISAMEQLYNKPGATDFEKMQLGFGLGKAFEELQNYKQAFEYWSVANRCQRILSPYNIQNAFGEMKAMQQIFGPELLADADGARAGQVPIFIVGMPRSGTSLTEQILASHSAVYGAGELELIGQLVRKAAQGSIENLGRLRAGDWRELGAEYLAGIAQWSDGESYVVNKLPENFLYLGVIRMMLADAIIIHCRRDPMDTGLSCFKNHFLGSRLDYTCELNELGTYYRHYEALMAHWRDVLPDEIYVSTYETLVASPETKIPGLLDFCGLPFEETCMSFHKTKRMVATASMAQVRQPIHQRSVQKWRYYEQELQSLRAVLEMPVSL
jgi:tetratricopeptide (TPR) repeat protein